jgi:aspartokinase-like uncharacterized kinase
MPSNRILVKVGGSLLDWPALGSALDRWLPRLETPKVLLLAGGGAAADVIRDLDRIHDLGAEAAHWLAIRAMALNSFMLEKLLPRGVVVASRTEAAQAWEQERVPILVPLPCLQADEGAPGALPHSWAVTSDSIAARLALILEMDELILLKSCPVPPGLDGEELARLGVVDEWFPRVASALPAVQVLAFRSLAAPASRADNLRTATGST